MAKPVILTSEGLANLENELEELKTVKRKDIADKIKVAISFGDLSENSEYDEARILQIETMLKNVKVLDVDELNTDVVNVGSKVKLKDVEFDEEETFHIVGSTEADPANGKISDESPVGKALLGHKVGDKVDITVPSGAVISYEVLEIMM